MDSLLHDIKMVLLVAFIIVICIVTAVFLSFVTSYALGNRTSLMRQHVSIVYTPIDTHNFNHGGMGWVRKF